MNLLDDGSAEAKSEKSSRRMAVGERETVEREVVLVVLEEVVVQGKDQRQVIFGSRTVEVGQGDALQENLKGRELRHQLDEGAALLLKDKRAV